MREEVVILRGISYFSIIKISITGLLVSLLPIVIALSALAFFRADTIMWNGRFLYGFEALKTGLPLGLLLNVLIIFIASPLVSLGIWIYSILRPIEVICTAVSKPECNT